MEKMSGITSVRQVGSSLGVIINKLVLEEVGLKKEDKLIVYVNDNGYIIPEEWEMNKLGNLMDFKNGLNYKSNNSGELIKIVGVGDFKSNFYLNTEIIDYININTY